MRSEEIPTMPSRAVFVDRDNTLIEDPGYLTDPADVKLMPGVDLALRSLIQGEYKIVVVTNQSGVARGLLTEQRVEEIHNELRRQLEARKLHLDGIYACPFHPEGTVSEYARDSDLRKPNPGMLLRAAEDLEIDLEASWMVGDSARDVLAGARAGCKTVRIRGRRAEKPDEPDDEAQAVADFTVRTFVDAARVILRSAAGAPVATDTVDMAEDFAAIRKQRRKESPQRPTRRPEDDFHYASPAEPAGDMDDAEVLRRILQQLMRLGHRLREDTFTVTKMLAGLFQILAMLGLWMVFWQMWKSSPQIELATVWGLITISLQIMALTFFVMHRQR